MRSTILKFMACALLLAPHLLEGQTFSTSQFTTAGGGGASSGGGCVLNGTIGQSDAGKLSQGNFALHGGFWACSAAHKPGEPWLKITQVNPTTLKISWGPAADGWLLEYTEFIQGERTSWYLFNPPYESDGTQNWITTGPFFSARFFRLVHGVETVILGNMPGDSNLSYWNGVGLHPDDTRKAVGLTMGGQGYIMTKVRLTLGAYDQAWVVNPTLRLHLDSGGKPSSVVLSEFISPQIATGIGDYTFVPTNPCMLLDETRYWLVLSSGSNLLLRPSNLDVFSWRGRDPQEVPAGPAATWAGHRISHDGGASWTSSDTMNAFEVIGFPL